MGRAVRREGGLELVRRRKRRLRAEEPHDPRDERACDRGRAADVRSPADGGDRSALGRGELEPAAEARVAGETRARRCCSDRDGLGKRGRVLGLGRSLVAGGRHHQHAGCASSHDRIPQRRRGVGPVDAGVHHCRAVVDRVVDRGCGVGVERDPVEAEHAERHELAREARSHPADPVVRPRRGDAGDGGAVPARRIRGIVVAVDEVASHADCAGEVRVARIDAGVDDGDDHSGRAGGHVPGRRKVETRVRRMRRLRIGRDERLDRAGEHRGGQGGDERGRAHSAASACG